MKNDNLLSHTLTLKDVISMAVILVSMFSGFAVVYKDMAIMRQQQEEILAKLSKMENLYTRVGNHDVKIATLEAEHKALMK